MLQDFRQALRGLRARPGLAAAAVLSLALGTGLACGAVTVLRASALGAGWLPARRAARLDPVAALREG